MTAIAQHIPSFLSKSSQELKYPLDKLVVYPDGTKKVYEKGQLRDVGLTEDIYHGDLIAATPYAKYYHLKQ